MAELGTHLLLWCAFALFVAGVVKGILGIGVPVVSVSLLSLAISMGIFLALTRRRPRQESVL